MEAARTHHVQGAEGGHHRQSVYSAYADPNGFYSHHPAPGLDSVQEIPSTLRSWSLPQSLEGALEGTYMPRGADPNQ